MSDSEQSMAYVTLATTNKNAIGSLVLLHSIRATATPYPIIVLYTPHITSHMKEQLFRHFDECIPVEPFEVIKSNKSNELRVDTSRPDLEEIFYKLHCWKLVQFEKCVFVDSNVLVLSNIDELFSREELSASRDCTWPDSFSTRLFVYRPNIKTFHNLVNIAIAEGSFTGGDHAILNLYFSDWAFKDIAKHLPHIFNVSIQSFYSYLPAYTRFGGDAKAVNFMGNLMPWSLTYNVANNQVEGASQGNREFLNKWWQTFMDKVYYSLPWQIKKSVNLSSVEKDACRDVESKPSEDYVNYETSRPFILPAVQPFYKPTSMQQKRDNLIKSSSFHDQKQHDSSESISAPKCNSKSKQTPEDGQEEMVVSSKSQALGSQYMPELPSDESSEDDQILDEDLYDKEFLVELEESYDKNCPVLDPPEYIEHEKNKESLSIDNYTLSQPRPVRRQLGVLPSDEYKVFKKAIREHIRNQELIRISEDVRTLKHPLESKDFKWSLEEKKAVGNHLPILRPKQRAKIQVKCFKSGEDFKLRSEGKSLDVNSNKENSIRPDDCVAVLVRKFADDGKKLKKPKSKEVEKKNMINHKKKYYPKELQKANPSAEDEWRRGQWERGEVDYMGTDSFDNILKKLKHSVNDK